MKISARQTFSEKLRFIYKPTLIHWLCGIIVILATFAYALTGQLSIKELLPKHTIFYGILTPYLLAYFDKYNLYAKSSLKVLAAILAFIFSQFITIDGSFYHIQSWDLCFGSLSSMLIWIVRSLIYSYVFYKILLGILRIIEDFYSSNDGYHYNILKWFLLIVGVRLFTLILFYPCVFGFDAAVGLRTYLDSNCATCDHHPYFIQVIHGLFFSLGKDIGHISLGFALLSVLFILSSSGIILYGLKLFEKLKLSHRWLISIAIVYAVFPLFPYLSINPTKDGFFAYALLLYELVLFELYISQATCLKDIRYLILHNIAILLICLTRHQGIYIVILTSLFLIFNYRNYWKKILLITIPSLCIIFAYNKILLPYNNVEPAGKQEVYGTLFQQTANYLKQYPDDVTNKELTAINKVLNSDTIVSKYTFDKTDAVKNGYRYNPWYRVFVGSPSMFRHIDHTHENEDIKDYLSAWFSMGLKHPLSYIEASLGVSAGFFYNFNRLLLETEPRWAENGAATTPEYRFAHFNTIARIYNNRIYSWFKYPILNWIIAIPYYNWAAIILIALLFYRKDWKGLTVFLPVLLSLGILLICPMIYGRYAYPIVIGLPLLSVYAFSSKNKTEDK